MQDGNSNEIEIRQARDGDYPAFRIMEEEAWKGSEIEIISEKMFNSWLQIFPEGFKVAVRDEKIIGHVYQHICLFDPYNPDDNRNWEEMLETHDPKGNALYLVSLSACGAGRELLAHSRKMVHNLAKQYGTGACRLPGLKPFAENKGYEEINRSVAEEYVAAVQATLEARKKREKIKERWLDPVLYVELAAGARCVRVVENFLKDKASENWACLVCYENPEYTSGKN